MTQRSQGDKSPSRGPRGWRRWVYRLLAMTLVPALFLLTLEGVLRLAGYGHATSFFERVEGRDAYTSNGRFGWRFFPPRLAREPLTFVLPAEKAPETCRIFVLGGSAAQGMPDASLGFARVLEVMLERSYPDVRFEVINAAMTAVNSHVVLEIARDCARREPDLFVVYMGNNEVVGPYGPGTILTDHVPSVPLVRAGVWARSTRIGQLLGDLVGLAGRDGEGPSHWRGMEMFLEQRVPAYDPRLEAVYAALEANLRDICRAADGAGARTVVCTVGVNLRDCPPFASVHGADLGRAELDRWEASYERGVHLESEGRFREAVEAYEATRAADDAYADLHFRLARCLLADGRAQEAGRHFALARDLDALRFRADSRVNQVIREVASRLSTEGVRLADVEEAMAAASGPHRVAGEDLFYDHVHMTFDGNYVAAAAVFDQVAALAAERFGGALAADAPDRHWCARRLALTDWDTYRMAAEFAKVTARPPFTNQLGHAERHAARLAELERFREGRLPQAAAEAIPVYRQALETAPNDWQLRRRFGLLLSEAGEPAAAAEQWRKVLEAVPHDAETHVRLGSALVALGRDEEAEAHYREAIRLRPGDSAPYRSMGTALLKRQEAREAARWLRRAVGLEPGDADARLNLGMALLMLEEHEESAEHLEESVRIAPSALGHLNLAGLRRLQGRPEDAFDHYRKALALKPDYFEAHFDRGTLRLETGEVAGAEASFAAAVRARPEHGPAQAMLARALDLQGKTREAVAAYRRAVSLVPGDPALLARLAWILATHPDATIREGTEAVPLARRACELTEFRRPEALDAYAAALAETGEFETAVEAATRAAELARAAGRADLAEAVGRRIRAYRAGKAWRGTFGRDAGR